MANVIGSWRTRTRGGLTPLLESNLEGIASMYDSGMSQREIAEALGCSKSLVGKIMRRNNIKTAVTSSRIRGDASYRWKGGRWADNRGYIKILAPENPGADGNGYVQEHRLVAERAIGRRLRSNEVVHHINGDSLDNRNCNLLICDRPYHSWLEWKMGYLYKREHFASL